MNIQIGPKVYRVVVVPGQLRMDGRRIAALTHRQEILISGELDPYERMEAVADQCRRLWIKHCYCTEMPEVFVAFFVDLFRQITRQGGEEALLAMTHTPPQEERRAA